MQEIEKLLQDKLGLEISSVGQSTLQRAVHRRMQALKLDDENLYLVTLQTTGSELNELVEEVVIPETWFFRDTHPFIVLTSYVAKRLQKNSAAHIRMLSAPCSSGEEAYSMTISLLEANIPPERFSIHGMDISTRSLEKAAKGIYRQNSFREKKDHLRYKYFQQQDNLYVLKTSVKNKVRFQQGNILDNNFISSLGTFDVLFCRNVLIYLDDQSRKRALTNIKNALAHEGILFVGHAESGLIDRDIFRSSPYPKAFAFYKNISAKKEPLGIPDKSKQLTFHNTLLTRSYKFSTTSKISKPADTGPRLPQSKPAPQTDLGMVKLLIDEGKIEPAKEIVINNIQACGPSAEAYYLLGMISFEKGDTTKANTLLRKAVYLTPDHIESLMLLSMLAEKAGDFLRVQIFEERIARIKSVKK